MFHSLPLSRSGHINRAIVLPGEMWQISYSFSSLFTNAFDLSLHTTPHTNTHSKSHELFTSFCFYFALQRDAYSLRRGRPHLRQARRHTWHASNERKRTVAKELAQQQKSETVVPRNPVQDRSHLEQDKRRDGGKHQTTRVTIYTLQGGQEGNVKHTSKGAYRCLLFYSVFCGPSDGAAQGVLER